MAAIYLVGTADTKPQELTYLRQMIDASGLTVRLVNVGTRTPGCAVDVSAIEVAGHHPDGATTVLSGSERGPAVAAMAIAFARFCAAHQDDIAAMIGIGGGGGTSIITAGMRGLPYGVPKIMVSTLASGDVGAFIGTSDLIMMPSVTDLAGLNRISRHILHNAAQAIIGMAQRPFVPTGNSKRALGLTMFGVTTPSVTRTVELLEPLFDCVVFHATGTGGRSMEQLLAQGMLEGLIDITTTEIADELVGGVLSAGAARLDAVVASGKPYVGSVGALDMVNFWAPETVPLRFKDRIFYHHNANVTLMRTTVDECTRIGVWMAEKLRGATGPVCLLLPERGVSALDILGGPFWDPSADAALFDALEEGLRDAATCSLRRLPLHINDPAFSAAAVKAYMDLT